jgi:hypothetical protein
VPLYQAMYSTPGPGVDELALAGGEEALGEGVVPALALAADRQRDLAVSGEGGVLGGGVLAAPVTAEDHAGETFSSPQARLTLRRLAFSASMNG